MGRGSNTLTVEHGVPHLFYGAAVRRQRPAGLPKWADKVFFGEFYFEGVRKHGISLSGNGAWAVATPEFPDDWQKIAQHMGRAAQVGSPGDGHEFIADARLVIDTFMKDDVLAENIAPVILEPFPDTGLHQVVRTEPSASGNLDAGKAGLRSKENLQVVEHIQAKRQQWGKWYDYKANLTPEEAPGRNYDKLTLRYLLYLDNDHQLLGWVTNN